MGRNHMEKGKDVLNLSNIYLYFMFYSILKQLDHNMTRLKDVGF